MGGARGNDSSLLRITNADVGGGGEGDFNVSLEAEDRPNKPGGQDPDSEGF